MCVPAVWNPSYHHAMPWHLPWGDVNPWSCCANLGPSPILTLRTREGADLRVLLYSGRITFSGFQARVLPWGSSAYIYFMPFPLSWTTSPTRLACCLVKVDPDL